MAATVCATWGVLIVLLLAPALLPAGWHHYIYSPAGVGLWMLSMLVAPFVVCAVKGKWVKDGGKRD